MCEAIRWGSATPFIHSSGRRLISAAIVAITAPFQNPAPAAIPIAPTSQTLAAVVRPRIVKPWRKISPAPRKPMPVTTWAATRLGSTSRAGNSSKPYAPTMVKSAEPTATSTCVRSPAAFSSSSRSRPTSPPRPAATAIRASASSQVSCGSSARSSDCILLSFLDHRDAARGQLEQLVELVPAERHALGRRLHLDQATVPGHHHVQVDVRGRVLDVVEVEQQLAADNPERDRRDRVGHRLREPEAVERTPGGDVRAGDRRAT